jgi:predicted nuclease of predicted toxin-antitoxin system
VRLISDENVPRPLVNALREDGHDVLSGLEELRSQTDAIVLGRAVKEGRVLITFDRDFGEMIFARGFAPPPGIIFVREIPRSLVATIEAVRAVVNGPAPRIDGYFVAIDRKARYHPLPVRRPHE